VSALDHWNGKTIKSIQGSKVVTAIKSSTMIQNDIRRVSFQSPEIMEAKLYLVRYEE